MKIALQQYETLYLTWEQLCVAAAVMNLPCIYGLSARWMQNQEETLQQMTLRVEQELEQAGHILPQFDGTVRMEQPLYRILSCMGNSERIGRICCGSGSGQGRLYLYQNRDGLAFMEPDLRGGCRLGILPSSKELKQGISEIPSLKENVGQELDLFDREAESWMTILLFEKQGSLYQRIMDAAWKESGTQELLPLWQQACDLLQ